MFCTTGIVLSATKLQNPLNYQLWLIEVTDDIYRTFRTAAYDTIRILQVYTQPDNHGETYPEHVRQMPT